MLKLLAALFGKHDINAEPKTLEQAKGIISTLKANAEKLGELFAEAQLDAEALLAQGKTALKDQMAALIAPVTAQLATSEANLAEAKAKADAALAAKDTDKAAVDAKLLAAQSTLTLFASAIGIKPDELAAKKPDEIQAAFNTLIAARATEKLGEMGFPEGRLPAADPATGGAGDSLDDIRAQIAATSDPAVRGRLAARAQTIRNRQSADPSRN